MAAVRVIRVPARDKEVYAALADSWAAAYIHGTADKATAVSNWSYVPKNGTWLVQWGPCPMVGADGKAWTFADGAREWTSPELRERFGILTAAEQRAAATEQRAADRQAAGAAPTKAQVVAAARRLAELVDDIPEDIAAIIFHGAPARRPLAALPPVDVAEVATGLAVAV